MKYYILEAISHIGKMEGKVTYCAALNDRCSIEQLLGQVFTKLYKGSDWDTQKVSLITFNNNIRGYAFLDLPFDGGLDISFEEFSKDAYEYARDILEATDLNDMGFIE